MPKEKKLVIGVTITKEEYEKQFEDLKAVNEQFKGNGIEEIAEKSGLFPDFHGYKPLTDEALQEKILNPIYKRIKAKARAVKKMEDEICRAVSEALPEDFDAEMGKIWFLTSEFTYALPGLEKQKEKMIWANREQKKKLLTPEGRKAFYDNLTDKLIKLDIAGLYAGNFEKRLDCYIKNYVLINYAPALTDVVSASMKKDGYDTPGRLDNLKERMSLLESAADIKGMIQIAQTKYYPLLEGQEEAACVFVRNTIKEAVTKDAVSENFSPDCIARYKKDESLYLTSMMMIRHAGAWNYASFDEEDGKIDFKEACLRMSKGQRAVFKERTPDDEPELKTVIFDGLKQRFAEEVEFEQLDEEEKAGRVDVWFTSLTRLFSEDYGKTFDIDNKFETYRLHEVLTEEVIDADGEINSKLIGDLDIFGQKYGTVRDLAFLDRAKSLNELSLKEQEHLYALALAGKLSLHAKDGNPTKEKAIYVKMDGEAGASDLFKLVVLFTKRTGKDAKKSDILEQLYEEAFPEALDPVLLTTVYLRENDAVNRYKKESLTDDSHVAYLEQTVFQLYTLKDAGENPEFYSTPELSKARLIVMNRSVKDEVVLRFQANPGQLTDQVHPEYNLKPEEVGQVYKKHPIGEAMVANKLLHKIQSDIDKDQDGYFLSMLPEFLKNDNGEGYVYNESCPWELSEKIALDIRAGKNIYLKTTNRETWEDNYARIVVSPGKCELQDVELLDENAKVCINDWLNKCAQTLTHFGATNQDSKEFMDMCKMLAELKEYFSHTEITIDDGTVTDKMKALFNTASIYFIAKIPQIQTSRRLGRFMVAETLRMGAQEILAGRNPNRFSVEKLKEDVLASKVCRLMMEDRVPGPEKFLKKVREYEGTMEFRALMSQNVGAKYTDSLETLAEKLAKAKNDLWMQKNSYLE